MTHLGSGPITEAERQTVLQYREEATRIYEVSRGSHYWHYMLCTCRQDVILLALTRKPAGNYENAIRDGPEDKPTRSVDYTVGL